MNAFELPSIKKVAIIGPECTGKSDLSNYLADYFKTTWVPEYARGYMERMTHPYQEHDLLTVAHGQLRLEDEWLRDANQVLICDTNLYVIKVWSEFRFGNVHKQITESLATRKYDLYLLTYVDIPWEADPLREHPDKRNELYNIYLNEMKGQSVPFVEIKGEREQRRKTAVEAVESLLKKG